jgi:hypothetical protein
MNKMIVSYDTAMYDFAAPFKSAFNTDLQKIHTIPNNSTQEQKWNVSNTFYWSEYKTPVITLYEKFVKEVVVPTYTQERSVYVQTEPAIRYSLPGSSALEKKDTDVDDLVGVHIDSVIGDRTLNTGDNYLLAITDMFGSNTLFVEDNGQFNPVTINYGEYYTFQGKSVRHGNKINTTGVTRISLDFRVIPGSQSGDADVDLSFSTKYTV